MRKITDAGIRNTKCGEYLLSDENIYHAIYSLNSYVFEYDLLCQEDRILYHRLQDKFDEKNINITILKVKDRIKELLKEDKYIEAEVYFKPKKIAEDGIMEFRPLHTTDLITQIAIVSMLHLFIYEIPDKEDDHPKLRLSNLSRLIPSDFYGNRVSVKPEYLFKPWKQQYQKYNQNSNEALTRYHTSLEYKYEVTLDLKNFFPTINPIIVYYYIIAHLPAYLEEKELDLLKQILRKLLFCKLKTKLDKRITEQYFKVNEKPESDKGEITEEDLRSYGFVRGIPQGLPQSYFFGNIYMISVSKIFKEKFPGKSYFYVDDSVLFTNYVLEEAEQFKNQLKEINNCLQKDAEEKIKNHKEDNHSIYPKGTEEFYENKRLYGVEVHLDGKSTYSRLDSLDKSEVYLKCISREMSQVGSDFFKMYSDEENKNLEAKLDILSQQVKIKRDQLELQENDEKEKNTNSKESEPDSSNKNDTKKFKDRLTRAYRFFEYRKQRLTAMHKPENESDEEYKDELKKIIYRGTFEKEDDTTVLQRFMYSFNADIWGAAIGMYQTFADDKELKELEEYIDKIDKLCYGKKPVEYSYLRCVYRDLLSGRKENDYSGVSEEYMTEEEIRITYNDPYRSLKRLAMIRLKNYTNKHYEVADRYSCKLLEETDENILMKLLSEDTEKRIPAKFQVVCANTQKIIRMVLNTIYSFLFSVEISDHPVLAKKSKKALTYGELRILSFLRNPLFTVEEFRKREIKLDDRQNKDTVDYSIMMVMEIFYSFVKDPVSIDKLIITHKYTCDVWKNGSKYLYFYTLHNQEHAIDLIKNIVKLVHAIDFINISAIDYYILFLACYLHDISMVRIPSYDGFLIDMNQADELAKELLDDLNKELFSKDQEGKSEEEKNQSEKVLEEDPDILIVKKYMLESYKKVDNYFEKAVRGHHAVDSAAEIRNRTEIKYLDTTMRELVAEVSEAHCADERNIYGAKSNATSQLISIKYDKILLRLADLLDMSSYRVSKPILHHNIEQMSEESAFHWISHLLTQKYKLHSKYEISDPEDEKSILAPQTITENIVLEIPVDLSQMSALECNNPCQKVKIDRKNILPQEITLTCGEKCEDDSEGDVNSERRCNFLCQWFCVKNDYLIKELAALKEYLNRNTNNYFKSEIQIKIKCNGKTNIDARQFEILTDYIQNKKR